MGDVDGNDVKNLAFDLFNLGRGVAFVRIDIFLLPFVDDCPGVLRRSAAKIIPDCLLGFVNAVQNCRPHFGDFKTALFLEVRDVF